MKYLYIDDDPNSQTKVNGFTKDVLEIIAMCPKSSWEEQLKFLSITEYDGLILDLKLDDIPVDEEHRTQFRGTALAQEIRTRQKEKSMRCFPLVLFSANDNLQESLDSLGKDLFDICINKTNIKVDDFSGYSKILLALAEGYNILNQTTEINTIFEMSLNYIDSRVCEAYEHIKNHESIPALAQFIINQIIEHQGVLIDEQMLAARLGIDIEKSSADWTTLLQMLSFAQYKGVFHNGWPRWWMSCIEQWWNEHISQSDYLRSTPASKRVDLLSSQLGLHLIPATKTPKSYSEKFWTVCRGSNSPLDPNDGLLIINQDNLYPWQDKGFVSVDAALNKTNRENGWIGLSETENERFNEIKVLNNRPMR